MTDFVDQLLDPQEVEGARKEQLAKVWARGAFTPVHKSEIPYGSKYFPTNGSTSAPRKFASLSQDSHVQM